MNRRHVSKIMAVLVCLQAAVVHAQCTTVADVTALRVGLHSAMRCRAQLLRGATAADCATPPPVCARSLVDDSAALAFGNAMVAGAHRPSRQHPVALDASAGAAASRCQHAIARSVEDYVGRRLYYAVKGLDPASADTKARVALAALAGRCAVPVVRLDGGGVLPSVGPQCAAAVGSAGNTVAASQLRDCLHTLLQRWVDRWGPKPQPLRPNIVFILADDQRWDTTDGTHAPAGELIMPKLHAELGASGVYFRNAFMTTPLCCPSRSSILRGQYSHTTGVHSNTGPHGGAHVFDDSVSLGTLLQSAGYRTGFYGKYLNAYAALWGSGAPPYVPPGWDEWHAFKAPQYFNYTLVRNGTGYDHVEQQYGAAAKDYSTDVLRELAKQFIESSVAQQRPFFLYLAPKAPHLPLQPAPRHKGKYASLPAWRPESYNEPPIQVADMPRWIQNTPRLTPAKRDDLDNTRRKQLEMLQAVDELIGGSTTYGIEGIMQTLRRLGIADDTLVVYFSDNGYMWGEHRQSAKNKPYEEAIRAPMFVRYPPLAPLPRVDDALILNIDLCPTFAALAGVSTPPISFEGRPLEGVLDGTATDWRTDFVTEGWALGREWVTVRESQWKYTETTDSALLPVPPIEMELYDVITDPLELRNVAGFPEQAERAARLAARLRELRPQWPQDANGEPEDEDE